MTNTGLKKNKYVYIDLIRIISCIFVVFIHVSAMEWDTLPVKSIDWNTANIFNCVGMNGVPLFFMISGALFLNKDYQITTRKLVINKIGKLLIAYYLTVFFYNIVPFFKGWVRWEWHYIKECLIEGVIYGTGLYHIWFIPVLLVLYMLTPILKETFLKKKVCEYYLLLYSVIGIILPTLQLFELPGQLDRFFTHYQSQLSLFMVTGYIGYFVLGHYLHSFVGDLSKKKKIAIGIVTCCAVLFTIIGCAWDSFRTDMPSSLFNTPFSINVFISCSGMYLLIREWAKKVNSEKIVKNISGFAKYTLGIYLLHPFVLDTFTVIADLKNIIPIGLVCIIFQILLTLGITSLIVFVLKKIPVVKKII